MKYNAPWSSTQIQYAAFRPWKPVIAWQSEHPFTGEVLILYNEIINYNAIR